MFDDPKSKINQLEKVLDAREDKVTKRFKRHDLHEHESNVPSDWDNSDLENGINLSKPIVGAEVVKTSPTFSGMTETLETEMPQKPKWPMKVLIGSAIFFGLAILAVLYKLFFGGIVVSADNIDIGVRAPVSIGGGDTLPLEIEITNYNNVSLLGLDLGITYPAGTMQSDNISVPLKREQIFIGDLASGKSIRKNLKVVMYGSENERKNIELALEYKVTGSNSLFNKKKIVPVLISTAPVSLVVTAPKSVNTNQVASFQVDINSNSTSVIKNLILNASYPFGFTFLGSNPQTYNKNNAWLIGDLAPGEKRTIKFTGLLAGQEGEERGFNFSLGNQSKADETLVETAFNTAFTSLTIRRPFVSADLFLDNSDSKEVVTAAGEKLEGVIKWKNNLPYQVNNVSILVKLSGNALNKAGVQADGGFYRSQDETIIFDKTTSPVFASLEPGQEGESKFQLKSFSINSSSGSILSNPSISIDISVQGKTIATNGQIENISFNDYRKIKVTSEPRLFVKSLYNIGPFTNTGPIPPKAEKETTYTITWTVTNPLNALTGAKITTTLPPYVKWLDKVSPGLEKISFDSNNNQVIWSLGNVPAGAGSTSVAKEVSFQISFIPSVSQIGEEVNLTGESQLIAKDSFTSALITKIVPEATTLLSTDPYFKDGQERVLK